MIFVNRRRIKQNSGIVKDPTKYWYIEKYVYGVLKETVEIPLGTSTTFGSIDSGYSDDTFYGWSVSSTSTKRTFTSTSSYKNTTTAVKNNLDSENTLKIYAIYKYTETTWSISNSTVESPNLETEIEVSEDGTAVFGGLSITPGSATSDPTYTSITLPSIDYYAKIDGINISGTVFYSPYSAAGIGDGTKISKSVSTGQIITIKGYATGTKTYYVNCTVPHWEEKTSTKYRVTRN